MYTLWTTKAPHALSSTCNNIPPPLWKIRKQLRKNCRNHNISSYIINNFIDFFFFLLKKIQKMEGERMVLPPMYDDLSISFSAPNEMGFLQFEGHHNQISSFLDAAAPAASQPLEGGAATSTATPIKPTTTTNNNNGYLLGLSNNEFLNNDQVVLNYYYYCFELFPSINYCWLQC